MFNYIFIYYLNRLTVYEVHAEYSTGFKRLFALFMVAVMYLMPIVISAIVAVTLAAIVSLMFSLLAQ